MILHTGNSARQFPESETTSSITEGAESSNGTEAESKSQPSVKPYGSAAAKFKIRSAKTLTTKDLRKQFSFDSRIIEHSSQKSRFNRFPSSSDSYSHTSTDDKDTGTTLIKDTLKDSTLPISAEKGDVSAKKLNTQQLTAREKSSGDELRRCFQTSKSKSLDWRGTGSRAGHGTKTGMTSGNRGYKDLDSFDRTGTNMTASYTQENQPHVSCKIQDDQTSDRNVCPVSGSTSLRMNRIHLALEQAKSGQSLPTRLKPRLSIGEGSSLWSQQQGDLSLDQADNRKGSWVREQGHSNTEEVSGNQTIKERINKLFGGDAKSDEQSNNSDRLKRSNTLSSDKSLPKSMDTVDCTPSHRKYTTDSVFRTSSDSTDSQQENPSQNIEKAGTFPRGFSPTYFGPKQEPSVYKENRNDKRDTSSGLQFSVSSKPKWSAEMSSVKKVQSPLPEDNEEKSRKWTTGSPKYSSQSLDRTRSKLSATAQYNTHRNQSASSDSSSSISKNRCIGGLQDVMPQPNYPIASKGTAYKEICKQEEKDDLLTLKTEGRRGEGVLEKLRAPSLDSVKNTISMFESLAQQSKGAPQIPRRFLSVPDYAKPESVVKKSNSDKNLHFERVVGKTENVRPNFFSRSDTKKETEGTPNPSRTPYSHSTVKVRPTLEQRQEPYKKTADVAAAFKQTSEKGESMTVNKKYTNEADFDITNQSRQENGAMEEKTGIPSISQQPNGKSLLKQQTIEAKIGGGGDDDGSDDENTPTTSPDRTPTTVIVREESNTEATTVNGTNPKVLSNNFATVQTIYSSLNSSNNNNHKTTSNDLTTWTTSMARWSSDEEDYDDEETETDSDSGESSVTITSNMSQSERRSFSLSLVDLCNYGGVEYKPSDGSFSEDGEELPSSRSASLSSDISAFSSVTLLSTEELDRLLDDVRGLGDDTLKKYEDVQVVVLHKEVGSGLGFTLAGGVDQNKPVTVHRIFPGGVAAQEGSIFEGAQVLSINGTSLQNSAHWEALRTLRKARGQAMAVVVLQRGNGRNKASERPGVTGRRIRVILNKSSSDLGFSLEGGVGSSSGDKPITVQKIFSGGPVSDVFPGDELLELQGRSLAGMMRLEAWNIIKKLPPGPVEVLLHRP